MSLNDDPRENQSLLSNKPIKYKNLTAEIHTFRNGLANDIDPVEKVYQMACFIGRLPDFDRYPANKGALSNASQSYSALRRDELDFLAKANKLADEVLDNGWGRKHKARKAFIKTHYRPALNSAFSNINNKQNADNVTVHNKNKQLILDKNTLETTIANQEQALRNLTTTVNDAKNKANELGDALHTLLNSDENNKEEDNPPTSEITNTTDQQATSQTPKPDNGASQANNTPNNGSSSSQTTSKNPIDTSKLQTKTAEIDTSLQALDSTLQNAMNAFTQLKATGQLTTAKEQKDSQDQQTSIQNKFDALSTKYIAQQKKNENLTINVTKLKTAHGLQNDQMLSLEQGRDTLQNTILKLPLVTASKKRTDIWNALIAAKNKEHSSLKEIHGAYNTRIITLKAALQGQEIVTKNLYSQLEAQAITIKLFEKNNTSLTESLATAITPLKPTTTSRRLSTGSHQSDPETHYYNFPSSSAYSDSEISVELSSVTSSINRTKDAHEFAMPIPIPKPKSISKKINYSSLFTKFAAMISISYLSSSRQQENLITIYVKQGHSEADAKLFILQIALGRSLLLLETEELCAFLQECNPTKKLDQQVIAPLKTIQHARKTNLTKQRIFQTKTNQMTPALQVLCHNLAPGIFNNFQTGLNHFHNKSTPDGQKGAIVQAFAAQTQSNATP